MIDKKLLKKNIEKTKKILKTRNFFLNINYFKLLEINRKNKQIHNEYIKYKRKKNSKKIGKYIKKKYNTKKIFLKNKNLNFFLIKSNKELKKIKNKINHFLLKIPNIPCKNKNKKNIKIKKIGKKKLFNFKIKDHINIGKKLGLNIKLSAKITGSRFMVMKGIIAKLYRALSEFMINTHLNKNGYTEYYIPYIVNEKSLIGTGQLPKFSENLFKINKKNIKQNKKNNFYLIPTGEVPLINLISNKILLNKNLPIKMVTCSPCFRLEPINYGKNTKGIIKQHQFDKVEIVQIVNPKNSYNDLKKMISHVEMILNKLSLPYRIMQLCNKKISFSASKTFDIEVWMPYQNKYIEISSISNCENFQSRRIKARFRNKKNKIKLVHTLNGSGLALGRTLAAIIENKQQKDGSINIPKILIPYMNGIKKILPY